MGGRVGCGAVMRQGRGIFVSTDGNGLPEPRSISVAWAGERGLVMLRHDRGGLEARGVVDMLRGATCRFGGRMVLESIPNWGTISWCRICNAERVLHGTIWSRLGRDDWQELKEPHFGVSF